MAKIYIPADDECEILDDLDFMSPARTVQFSVDGIHYEVDLSEKHVEEMRALLEPFIRFSHVVRREHARA